VSKPLGEIAYPTRIQALVAVVDLRRNGDVAFEKLAKEIKDRAKH